MSLHGKIAVITGASRGIGRAIALGMAKAGASVVVNYQTNSEAAAAVVREIEVLHEEAFAVQGDVGSVAGIRQFFQALDAELTKRHGSPNFDILVNNAGIGRGGTVFVTQEAVSRLRDGGRIINLSSALSKHAYPRMTAYSMGKAAINHFTLILAADLGNRGITVNCVAPGLTVTDFTAHARQDLDSVRAVTAHTALGRLGEAEDIAGVARWLASDDARWVTGQYIEASGGIGLR
jgi:NAD(P)-dependent dehydrogenase (short-subunit alcohol dehydrogenase family)